MRKRQIANETWQEQSGTPDTKATKTQFLLARKDLTHLTARTKTRRHMRTHMHTNSHDNIKYCTQNTYFPLKRFVASLANTKLTAVHRCLLRQAWEEARGRPNPHKLLHHQRRSLQARSSPPLRTPHLCRLPTLRRVAYARHLLLEKWLEIGKWLWPLVLTRSPPVVPV